MALVVTACGDNGMLDGVGERSQEAVLGDLVPSSTLAEVVSPEETLGVVLSDELTWWNDGIEGEATGEKNYVVAKVWARDPQQRVHQASRVEVIQVLPGVGFPGVVPEYVGYVTSQFVYDTASATLDAEFAVQFGLWPAEPYSEGSNVAVLRVGDAGEFRIDGIVSDVVDNGLSLSWTAGLYRYELFCSTTIIDELCWQMAEATTSLASQLPSSA
jgi:hypothetical protein